MPRSSNHPAAFLTEEDRDEVLVLVSHLLFGDLASRNVGPVGAAILEKGKPVARPGRKAVGPEQSGLRTRPGHWLIG